MRQAQPVTFSPRTIHGRPDQSPVVKSVQRTLEILEFFADYQAPANATQISDVLRYPQSSTSVLLKSLVTLGYLTYNTSNRTYLTTSRVAVLGGWLRNGLVQDGLLIRVLNTLVDELGEFVALVTRNGPYVQYIYVKEGVQKPPCRIGIGHLRPLVRSSAGLALLRDASNAEIQRLVMRANVETPEQSDHAAWSDVLERIRLLRTTGYAFSSGEGHPHGALVAMPIPGSSAKLAIAVWGGRKRIERGLDQIVSKMKNATAALKGLRVDALDFDLGQ